MRFIKNIVLLLSVIFCTITSISQNSQQKLDSLKEVLENEKNIDSIIEIKYNIALLQLANQSIDEARSNLHNLITYSSANKKEIGVAKASLILGRIFVAYEPQNDSALYYLDKAIVILKKKDLNTELIRAYLNKAQIYDSQSDYESQLKNALLALEVAKDIKDDFEISRCANALGSYFYHQEKYDEALQYAKYGLKHALLSKDKKRLMECQFMLAETYKALTDTLNANKYFAETYALAKEINNKFILVALLPDWADISENKEALKMRLEAEEILNQSDGGSQQTHNKGLLGILYFNMFKNENNPIQKREFFDKAEEYLIQTIDSEEDRNDMTYSISLNKTLSELYFAKEDYQKAYKYLEKATMLNDSINSQEIKNRLAKIESQKEIELRDKEIEVTQLKIASQKKQQLFLMGGVALLAIIGGMLLYQNHTRKKTNTVLLTLNRELDESNKIKARFFGILNHDLRAPVANLIQFLHLQKEVPEAISEEKKDLYESKTIAAAENLLVSMEDMLLWSKSQMHNFKPTFKKISAASIFNDIEIYFSDIENIAISFENPNNIELDTDPDYLKTIMRNLTANSIKALEKTNNATIVWAIKEDKGNFILSITDNGPGVGVEKFTALFDETKVGSIKTGLGLHLIRDLAKAIKCEIGLDAKAEKGTKITLQFRAFGTV